MYGFVGIIVLTLWSPLCHGQGLKHMAAHGHDGKHTHSHGDGKDIRPEPPVPPSSEVNQDRPVPFDEAFSKLLEFYKENKHSKVPQATTVTLNDGVILKLGKWFSFTSKL